MSCITDDGLRFLRKYIGIETMDYAEAEAGHYWFWVSTWFGYFLENEYFKDSLI